MTSLEYNTSRPKMMIAEYGRNVQKMVNFAVTVEDKEERNKVAQAIIAVMGALNPEFRDKDELNHKLWAHLFIMSDFKLDVDSPYPIPTRESFFEKPGIMGYPQSKIKFGHYGKIIPKMIDKAIEMPEGEEREALIAHIANCMKKAYLTWNRDTVSDDVIINQLTQLSDGKLVLKDPEVLDSTPQLIKELGITSSNNNQNNRKKFKKNSNKNRKKKRY
jgi:hypothetical protein